METVVFKQTGLVSMGIILPLLIITSIPLWSGNFPLEPESLILLIAPFILFLCLLTFYQLTIKIDDTSVTFKLGIGLIKKSYLLSDIKSCTVVGINALNGIGIRMITGGWLYNVSGLQAIELTFKNKHSVVRIGTNKPHEVQAIIKSRIQDSNIPEKTAPKKSGFVSLKWAIVLAIITIPTILITVINPKVDVKTNDTGITIEGLYGLTIPYESIGRFDTLNCLPPIKMRTNGYATRNTKMGNFRLTDKTNVKLFTESNTPPFLLIESTGNKPIYINFKDSAKTIILFNELTKKRYLRH